MDIQKCVSELLESGLTQQELANLVPCQQSTISSYLKGARGKRPSFDIGRRILDLHRQRCVRSSSGRRATDKATP